MNGSPCGIRLNGSEPGFRAAAGTFFIRDVFKQWYLGGINSRLNSPEKVQLLELCGAIQRPLRFSLRYAGVRKTVSGFFRQAWQYYRKRH